VKLQGWAAIVLFCICSAARDVASERLFREGEVRADVLVFGVFGTAAALAAVSLGPRALWDAGVRATRSRRDARDLVSLNLFTGLAYFLYFVAISTPLGASMNIFVDYAMNPMFTAAAALVLLGASVRHAVAPSVVCVVGMLAFVQPAVSLDRGILLGVVAAVGSAAAAGVYRVNNKALLDRGWGKRELVFLRLQLLILTLGLYLSMADAHALVGAPWGRLVVLGALGAFLPLVLFQVALQQLPIVTLAMALFGVPIVTATAAWLVGAGPLSWSQVPGAALILLGVGLYERRGRGG